MLRKPETIAFWVGRLPHWEVEDGRYFVTIHLAGAIPQQGRRRLRSLSEQISKLDQHTPDDLLRLQRMIFGEMERWLDRSQWNPLFEQRELAEMVVEAIEHRQTRGDWNVFEYVVMPTHIHLFCELLGHGLKETFEDFKRWTGHQAAKLLGVQDQRIWQREWFDHWSRSDPEDDRIVHYIHRNPEKAGLVTQGEIWPYGGSRSRLPNGT